MIVRNSADTESAIESLLPFVPVDELGCYVDKPAEPNNVHLEVVLDGHLDPAGLHAAVHDTLAAHPLARARRGRWHGWHRRFNWEIVGAPDQSPVDHVRWRTEEELAGHRQSLLDSAPPLDLSPPLRVRHAVGPDQDVLILNVHHAAMDGLSCLRLLRSIARRYAGRPDPVGADPLAVRVPAGGLGSPAPGAAKARYPRPAARIAVDSADPGPGCGFRLLSMPAATVRSGSAELGATVNDVLIATLVLAIEEWNGTHGRDAGTIRIAMPINARATAGADEPLGNLSRLAVIASKPADRRSADALLTDITRQTAAAKLPGGPQIDPISRLFATPLLPVAVKAWLLAIAQRLVGPAIVDTSLLSNLGQVGEPPDFDPDTRAAGLWFSPAVRMPAGLSVGVVTLNDRLNLCFRYRRELLDHRAADRFAATFRAALDAFGIPGS
jgi:NRPS condensation-like uncharacterized protein